MAINIEQIKGQYLAPQGTSKMGKTALKAANPRAWAKQVVAEYSGPVGKIARLESKIQSFTQRLDSNPEDKATKLGLSTLLSHHGRFVATLSEAQGILSETQAKAKAKV